jgi:ribosomal protein L11 methylase PrmA
VANLVRPLLAHVARAGFDGEPPRVLVVSGLLHAEADGIAAAFGRFGLRERARRHSGEWAALTLVRHPTRISHRRSVGHPRASRP